MRLMPQVDRNSVCSLLFFFLLASVFSACTSVTINPLNAHVNGYPYKALNVEKGLDSLISENGEALKWYMKNEWPFNKGDKTLPPQHCLALSGGGIRSAAFSIGVLKGLNEKKILDRIDVMSAVSGGSYALSWYYMQQYGEPQEVKDALFGKKDDEHESEYERTLQEHSRFYSIENMALSFLGDALLVPLNLFANGVFGWHMNTTPARLNYEYAIKKTFHGGKAAQLPQMVELINSNHLPFFIVNTTARIDEDLSHYDSKLSNTVFEFTPLRFGSDAFGYGYAEDKAFPFDVAGAVTVSGAALDSSAIAGSSQKAAMSVLNHDLGYYIDNYRPEFKEKGNWWVKLLPFPFYFFSPSYLRDKNGTDIYLSDGGHSENLGAFSLVKRLCQNIIIVDAEYDPNYGFESYFRLKNALKSEMQADLKVENIDRLQSQFVEGAVKGGIPERIDGTQSQMEEIEKCKKDKECTLSSRFSGPVAKGTIGTFPWRSPGGQVKNVDMRVTYVKLWIDEKALGEAEKAGPRSTEYDNVIDRYGKTVVEFYLDSKNGHCGQVFVGCAFPQLTTEDQSYSQRQFKAYVDLGYRTIKNDYREQ